MKIMANFPYLLFRWLILLTAAVPSEARGCTFELTENHHTIHIPAQHLLPSNDECTWTIRSPPGSIIAIKIPKFSPKARCDCSCGRITINEGQDGKGKIFCNGDLPANYVTGSGKVVVRFSGTKRVQQHPLFAYTIISSSKSQRRFKNDKLADSFPSEVLMQAKQNRVKRGSESNEKSLPERKSTNDGLVTKEPSGVRSGNNSVSNTNIKHRFNRLPVILPAVLTVVIFIACLALIAYKSYNADDFPYDGSALDIQQSDPAIACWSKRGRKKKHGKNELYDVMLKEYKAEKHRKDPLRKSSTIQIVGVAGNDPQSIAKKHLLLNKMRDSSSPGAVGTLIKLSSTALMASSMARKESNESSPAIPEEDSAPLLSKDEEEQDDTQIKDENHVNGNFPDELSSTSNSCKEKPGIPKIELVLSHSQTIEPGDEMEPEERSPGCESLSPDYTSGSKEHRNSGSVWFKYKRLEKQPYVADDSDEELDYDCAQHIQRILSASRENIEEARRILPDDVKDIILPKDLETAFAEFDLWPDSSV